VNQSDGEDLLKEIMKIEKSPEQLQKSKATGLSSTSKTATAMKETQKDQIKQNKNEFTKSKV
jgi:hypothetical protein